MVFLKIKRMNNTEVKIVDSPVERRSVNKVWGTLHLLFLGLGGDYMAFSYHCTFSGKYVCYVCT